MHQTEGLQNSSKSQGGLVCCAGDIKWPTTCL